MRRTRAAMKTGKATGEDRLVAVVGDIFASDLGTEAVYHSHDGHPKRVHVLLHRDLPPAPDRAGNLDDRRASIAAHWQEKYGVSIDDLATHAACTVVAELDLARALRNLYRPWIDRLVRQMRDDAKFVLQFEIPGKRTLADVLVRRGRARARDRRVIASHADTVLAGYQEYHAARLRLLRTLCREAWVHPPVALTGREREVPLLLAALWVSEWIRRRHRNRRGELDGKTSWPDTARCLEYFGHDLWVGMDVPNALRKRCARYWAEAADRTEA